MGKGGSSPPPQPEQQTVNQVQLPKYAKPYFQNILQRGQAESYRQYQPYEGERVAGFDPTQVATQEEALGMQRPEQIDQAGAMAYQSGLGSLDAGQYNPSQFQFSNVNTNYNPSQFNYLSAEQAGQYDPNQFTTKSFTEQGTAQDFMSPYMQNVVDRQKFEAQRDAEKADLSDDLGAARRGTYGGSRQLLADMERERNLERQLGDIQAQGSQAAYDRAQQAFEQEQNRRLQAQEGTEQSRQFGADIGMRGTLSDQQAFMEAQRMGEQSQQYGADLDVRSALANQQAGLEAQRMAEQSRQFGSQQGLAGLGQSLDASRVLGGIGETQQATDLQRLQAQSAVGQDRQSMRQQQLDTAYGDFLRQRDYPMERLNYFSNLLRGVPVQLESSQTSYAQPPSQASQMGGLGLAGLGLYNMYNQ